MKITLELTLTETNTVLASLAKQPFEVVYELIPKIQQQASSQQTKKEVLTEDK